MNTDAQVASAEAVHKAKNAAQAVEVARQEQLAEMVEKTAQRTKEQLLEGLREVFTNDVTKSPAEMQIMIQRVPILCTTVLQMHEDIADLKDNLKWGVRVILAAVVTAAIALLIK